jgi:hypothetical protein
MLGILIASGGKNGNAQWLNINTTDDEVPAVGMLLARLETLRAQRRGEGIGKVRLLPPSQYTCMVLIHGHTLFQTDSVRPAACCSNLEPF